MPENNTKYLLDQFKASHFDGAGPFTLQDIKGYINVDNKEAQSVINHGLNTEELHVGFMGYFYFS
jgi:hypothetical protein